MVSFSQGLCGVICGFEAGVIATSWALASVFGFDYNHTEQGQTADTIFLLGSQVEPLGVGVLQSPLLLLRTSAVGKFHSEDRETQMVLHQEVVRRGRERAWS